jgi:hypothetical protein
MAAESLEKLSVHDLKAKITRTWGKYQRAAQRTMGPLLYHLRKKLKAQGKSGAGFGAWVEDNVDLSRRTADRWADAYAVSKGLMKPRKHKAPTFRQLSNSGEAKPSVDGKVTVPLSFVLSENERDEFMNAVKILGDEATKVIYSAVISAAAQKKPVQSTRTDFARKVGAGR